MLTKVQEKVTWNTALQVQASQSSKEQGVSPRWAQCCTLLRDNALHAGLATHHPVKESPVTLKDSALLPKIAVPWNVATRMQETQQHHQKARPVAWMLPCFPAGPGTVFPSVTPSNASAAPWSSFLSCVMDGGRARGGGHPVQEKHPPLADLLSFLWVLALASHLRERGHFPRTLRSYCKPQTTGNVLIWKRQHFIECVCLLLSTWSCVSRQHARLSVRWENHWHQLLS